MIITSVEIGEKSPTSRYILGDNPIVTPKAKILIKRNVKNCYKFHGYCMGERLNSQHYERKRKLFCEIDHTIFEFAHLLKNIL